MSNLDPAPVDLEELIGMFADELVIEAYGTVTPPPDPSQEN